MKCISSIFNDRLHIFSGPLDFCTVGGAPGLISSLVPSRLWTFSKEKQSDLTAKPAATHLQSIRGSKMAADCRILMTGTR